MKKLLGTALLSLLISGTALANDEIIKTIQEAFEHYSVGGYLEAAPLFEEAYDMLTVSSPEDIKGRFKAAFYTGLSKRATGDTKGALPWFEASLASADISGNSHYKALIYSYIAEAMKLQDDYASAIKYYELAIKHEGLADKDKAALYYGIAESYLLSGDTDNALQACAVSDELANNVQLEKVILQCGLIRGESYRTTGDYSNALKTFGAVLDMSRARRYDDVAVSALNGAGTTAEALNRKDMARANYEEALNISLKNVLYDNVGFFVLKIIPLMPDSGKFKQNAENMGKYADETAPLNGEESLATRRLSAVYYKVSHEYAKAISAFSTLYKDAKRTDSKEYAIIAQLGLAEVYLADKQYELADGKLFEAYDEVKKIRKSADAEALATYNAFMAEINAIQARLIAASPDMSFSDIFFEE